MQINTLKSRFPFSRLDLHILKNLSVEFWHFVFIVGFSNVSIEANGLFNCATPFAEYWDFWELVIRKLAKVLGFCSARNYFGEAEYVLRSLGLAEYSCRADCTL